jgi:hypothetical protein
MATVHERFRDARFDLSTYPSPAPPAAADVETELEEFRRFLDKQMTRGVGNVSVDAVLGAFRHYQNELRRLRKELDEASARCDRGEAMEWNLEEAKAELRRRLAAKGVTE